MAKAKVSQPLPTNFVEISVGSVIYFQILIDTQETAFGLKSVTSNTNHRRALESALRNTELADAVRGMHHIPAGIRLKDVMQLATILPSVMVAMKKEFRQQPRAIKHIHERPDCRPALYEAQPLSATQQIGWRRC